MSKDSAQVSRDSLGFMAQRLVNEIIFSPVRSLMTPLTLSDPNLNCGEYGKTLYVKCCSVPSKMGLATFYV